MHSPFNDLCQRSILPWIIRGGSDVRHARDANELLEVASDELRAIVGDDSRLGFQVLLLGSLQDHFDIGFSHRLAQIPMHEETSLLQHPPNKMPPQDGYF